MGTVLCFSGSDSYRLREHTRKYFTAAQQKYGEFNVSRVDPETNDLHELQNELLSPPFFGEGKRVFFLDSFPFSPTRKLSNEKKEKMEKILETLQKIPEEVVVICISENPDRRNKAWKDLNKIADPTNSKEFSELTTAELTEWVLSFVKAHQGKILPAAAEYLWQYAGTNLWTLAQELRKLLLYSPEKPISERDIRRLCDPSFEAVQFALSNAFASGKKEEVHEIFTTLIRSGESAITILFRDLGSIMRQILLIKYALEEKKTAQEIGVHPFVFGKMKKITSALSTPHLKKMFAQLLTLDENTKTGVLPVSSGKEDLLIFALEQWIDQFFEHSETR